MSVIDNGPGVDPASRDEIFRPFVTTRARGTGLGLALVQKIVVTHNGRVTVQPEPGGGTRFTVIAAAAAIAEPLRPAGGRFHAQFLRRERATDQQLRSSRTLAPMANSSIFLRDSHRRCAMRDVRRVRTANATVNADRRRRLHADRSH